MIVVEKDDDDDDDDDDNKSRHSTTDRCSTTKRRKCLHVVVKNKPIQQEHLDEVGVVQTSPTHKSGGILSSSNSSQHALMGRWKPPDPPPSQHNLLFIYVYNRLLGIYTTTESEPKDVK